MQDPPSTNPNQDDMDEDEEDEEDEEDDEVESESGDETGGRNRRATSLTAIVEPSELMQIEMPDDIRIGSPNDGSNNLDSDFHLLVVSNQGNPLGHVDSYKTDSTQRWGPIEDPVGNSLQIQLPSSGKLVVIIVNVRTNTHDTALYNNLHLNLLTKHTTLTFKIID